MAIGYCNYCGATFEREPGKLRRSKLHFCSLDCRDRQVVADNPTLAERFWSKVNKNSGYIAPNMTTECWEWQGYRDPNGYGRIRIKRETKLAHRISYILTNGPIDEEVCVRHNCDHPPCVNPAHLVGGTQIDNIQDMVERGRHKGGANPMQGETHPFAKLTVSKVTEIRAAYATGTPQRVLARKYNIAPQTVYGLVHRKSWKHIP